MNAYLIEPVARTISVVNTDFSLQSIYALLGCKLISTAVGQANGDLMFIDDDVSEDVHEAFRIGSWEIYSRALVVGTDQEGETTSPKTPIEKFDAQVHWLGPKMFEPNIAFLSWEDFDSCWPGSAPN